MTHLHRVEGKILLFVSQFYNANIDATFTSNKLYIFKEEKVVLEGSRSKINSMWYINIQNKLPENNTPLKNIYNWVYENRKREESINYFYQELWNPVTAICFNAIKSGFSATWTGITVELITKHLKTSTVTTKLHQRSARSNAQSTRQVAPKI